jgi:hypothetical protein
MDPEVGLRPANPIYRDVIVRTLNYTTQAADLPASLKNRWMDGKTIDMTALLKRFQEIWRQNSEIWVERYDYKEAAPHLILQAALQLALNGYAYISREFATGRGRVDLCAEYMGKKYPVELKLARGRALKEGLEQTARYMDGCGAKEGWLVIFDRSSKKSWQKKLTWTTKKLEGGKVIHVVGC